MTPQTRGQVLRTRNDTQTVRTPRESSFRPSHAKGSVRDLKPSGFPPVEKTETGIHRLTPVPDPGPMGETGTEVE